MENKLTRIPKCILSYIHTELKLIHLTRSEYTTNILSSDYDEIRDADYPDRSQTPGLVAFRNKSAKLSSPWPIYSAADLLRPASRNRACGRHSLQRRFRAWKRIPNFATWHVVFRCGAILPFSPSFSPSLSSGSLPLPPTSPLSPSPST